MDESKVSFIKKNGFKETNCSGASEMKNAQDIDDLPNLQNIEMRLSKKSFKKKQRNKQIDLIII